MDDHSRLQWLYGLKTKDEALTASRRWMAEISELCEKYPLLVVMRDNAGENKSKEISDYITAMEVKSYFSTAYEQHQDGLAESGDKSTPNLALSGMAKSGLARKYWFSVAKFRPTARRIAEM